MNEGVFGRRTAESLKSETLRFTYDPLNRLPSSWTAATSGANCWGMTFSLDAWGNLYSNTALSGYANCAQVLLNLGVNGNNRITTSGFSYAAGAERSSATGVWKELKRAYPCSRGMNH